MKERKENKEIIVIQRLDKIKNNFERKEKIEKEKNKKELLNLFKNNDILNCSNLIIF